MARWTVVGCMALAALSAAAVLDVGSPAAEAAPSVSPFAGTYVGRAPGGWEYQWSITISDGGKIAGVRPGYSEDGISGRVSDDGRYSLAVTVTVWVRVRSRRPEADPSYEERAVTYRCTGDLAPDGDGNIVGMDDTLGSFVWFAQ